MEFTQLTRQPDEAKNIAPARTAILWGPEDLLGRAIESLLTAEKNWRVIKVLGKADVRAIAEAVEKARAEIIIINRGPCAESFPALLQVIENLPELKIITINPDNNLLEVYNKQKVCIEFVSDLLSVIDRNSKSPAEGGENQSQEIDQVDL